MMDFFIERVMPIFLIGIMLFIFVLMFYAAHLIIEDVKDTNNYVSVKKVCD